MTVLGGWSGKAAKVVTSEGECSRPRSWKCKGPEVGVRSVMGQVMRKKDGGLWGEGDSLYTAL